MVQPEVHLPVSDAERARQYRRMNMYISSRQREEKLSQPIINIITYDSVSDAERAPQNRIYNTNILKHCLINLMMMTTILVVCDEIVDVENSD